MQRHPKRKRVSGVRASDRMQKGQGVISLQGGRASVLLPFFFSKICPFYYCSFHLGRSPTVIAVLIEIIPIMIYPTFIFACDWFQVYCHAHVPLEKGMTFAGVQNTPFGIRAEYTIEKGEELSPLFNKHFLVTWKKRKLAHVSLEPRPSSLHPQSAMFKVDNRLLYESNWLFYLKDICAALCFEIRNISRVDIAADFVEFCDHRQPLNFVKAYMQNARKGHPSFIRCGSNKFCVYGRKSTAELAFDYVRWGSRDSEVCTYLYNKSKELRDKKDKPWIRERWHVLRGDDESVDVWRIEFSINSQGLKLANVSETYIFDLFIDDFSTFEKIRDLFYIYADKYFKFRVHEAGDTRKTRELPFANLLPPASCAEFKKITMSRASASGHTELVIFNRLQKIIDENSLSMSPKELQMFDYVARWFFRQYSGLKQKSEYKNAISDYLLSADPAFLKSLSPDAHMLEDDVFFRREAEKVALGGGNLSDVLAASKDVRKTHRLIAQMLSILYEHGFTF